MEKNDLVQSVLDRIRGAGFVAAGTSPARLEKGFQDRYRRWIEGGHHGPLDYMSDSGGRRTDPRALFPWANGVFCAALPYNTSRVMSAKRIHEGGAWVSRYAWGRDYHNVLKRKLKAGAAILEKAGYRARICVDSVPLLERALAVQAGLGFLGKNGMLIVPGWGSYVFLGELVTDLELMGGEAVTDGCGKCEVCLKGCPTGALGEPGTLDAGLCLSTWTIEHRGDFPSDVPPLHGHLFGCDRCQEVCPHNRRAPLCSDVDFEPRNGWFSPDPREIIEMSEDVWDHATRGSAVRRARFDGLRRNARRILDERDQVIE
jgi:epoxyqueuosine reductase